MITQERVFAEKRLNWSGEELIFSNQRVLVHPQTNSLILADVHLGKTAHFRKHGVAVPESLAQEDLARLADCINHYEVKQVIVAGDFFHAGANRELQLFKTWRSEIPPVIFHLVKGNHDRLSRAIYDDIGLQIHVKEMMVGELKITHHPSMEPVSPEICGHIHPGKLLKGKGRQRIKLPCFLKSDFQIVLPAFSLFTGLDTRFGHDDHESICIGEQELFLC